MIDVTSLSLSYPLSLPEFKDALEFASCKSCILRLPNDVRDVSSYGC